MKRQCKRRQRRVGVGSIVPVLDTGGSISAGGRGPASSAQRSRSLRTYSKWPATAWSASPTDGRALRIPRGGQVLPAPGVPRPSSPRSGGQVTTSRPEQRGQFSHSESLARQPLLRKQGCSFNVSPVTTSPRGRALQDASRFISKEAIK